MWPALNCCPGNQVGDACELDTDGDGLSDELDHCPKNPSIGYTDFRDYFEVEMHPNLDTDAASWQFTHDGMEIRQTATTDMPIMLIGTVYTALACVVCIYRSGYIYMEREKKGGPLTMYMYIKKDSLVKDIVRK